MTSYPARLLGLSLRDLSSEAHASNDSILIFILSEAFNFVIRTFYLILHFKMNVVKHAVRRKPLRPIPIIPPVLRLKKVFLFKFYITLMKTSINLKQLNI